MSINITRDSTRIEIYNAADFFAAELVKKGCVAEVSKSGSRCGASAYIKFYDPITEYLFDEIRISDHSKGAFNSQFYIHIWTDSDFEKVIKCIDDSRTPERLAKMEEKRKAKEAEELQLIQIRLKSAAKKMAKGKPLTKSEQAAVDGQKLQNI